MLLLGGLEGFPRLIGRVVGLVASGSQRCLIRVFVWLLLSFLGARVRLFFWGLPRIDRAVSSGLDDICCGSRFPRARVLGNYSGSIPACLKFHPNR